MRAAHNDPTEPAPTAEHRRLEEAPNATDPWRLWGPYLSARQWGTVREDYSADGDAWDAFPFDHTHRRTYRWGEDGIAGLCDRFGFLNLAPALWNRSDDRLKERFFGLTNGQGNHGEDVKEYWWHLDATPTHSYAQELYRYPQGAYPYADLLATNAGRSRTDPEYELADTGVLEGNRFFDVVVTHAKAAPDDLCVTIEATNHGPDPAPLDVVPQLWFRNTWRWGTDDRVPSLRHLSAHESTAAGIESAVVIEARHGHLGTYRLYAEGSPQVLACDNETNEVALWGARSNRTPYPKDGIDAAIVRGDTSLVNPAGTGTKIALRHAFDAVAPGQTVRVRLRLAAGTSLVSPFDGGYDAVLTDRRTEADEFYAHVIPAGTDPRDAHVARRAFAGLLWSRKLYRYDVATWLRGDPAGPPPPPQRLAREPQGRNTDWTHLYLADVISLPDAWEYPWFAAWDLAFHCVALAHVDPAFAKAQLVLMCREWSQHPDGQLPAYEWSFSDVNPPVHAWATWRVYHIDGAWDHEFLVRVFGKLLINFTWWVNRKDVDGSNLFAGGFLGMDNIGLFDRSQPMLGDLQLEQSDATSWMAFSCLNMLRIALELSRHDRAWDDLATAFVERFVAIAKAVRAFGSGQVALWDDADGFYYDILVNQATGEYEPLRVRSLVGLLPLLAVEVTPPWIASELSDFTARFDWLALNRADQTGPVTFVADRDHPGVSDLTLALLGPERWERLLARMLDEGEFLSPHGIRSLSAAYRDGVTMRVGGTDMSIEYDPAESTSGLFGGNSNWRGPVWIPVNVLLVDALRRYAAGAGSDVRVEFPTGSGRRVDLPTVAQGLQDRLVSLFRPGPDGRRPSAPRDHGSGPLWDPHPTFSEYFHGDTGAGLGASHQTGWSALVAHLICSPPPPDAPHPTPDPAADTAADPAGNQAATTEGTSP